METPTSTTDRPPGQRIGGSQWRHRRSDIRPWPWLLQQWCRSFYLALALTLSASGIAFAQSEGGGCNSSNTTHSTEVAALVSILQGFNTTSIPGWGSSHDPCGQGNGNEGFQAVGSGWAGVVCQKISDGYCTTTVSGLQLADMNIKGNLSPQIQKLKNLTLLIISGNPELTGPIPAGLANLNELVILDFHDNAFNGTIPTFQNLHQLQFLDLSGNQIEGPIPDWLGTLQQLQKLDLSNNILTGSLPVSKMSNSSGLNNMTSVVHMSFSRNNLIGGLDDLSSLRTLRTLNGSYNRFNSTFPAKLLQKENLPQLTVLDLSSNDLTGPMPDVSIHGLQQIYVANNSLNGSLPAGFVNSSSLQILNVDFNIISGTLDLELLPQDSSALQMISLVNNIITQVQFPTNKTRDLALLAVNTTPWDHLFLGGNPYCNDPQTTLQLQICRSNSSQILTKRTTTTSQTNNNLLIILITAAEAGIIVVLLLAHFFSIFCIKRLCQKIHSSPKELAKTEDVQPNLYSYNELKVATEDFSSDMRLGQGGLGIVYKGILPNDILVAVKQLNSSDLALAEFLNEIVTLSNVRHQNLVKLKGCCVKGDQRFVVYEYIENKNLAEALWDSPSKSGQKLNWAARFNIILGIARGLAYLHEEVNPPIVHRDIKAANILLDSNLNPKIGDFGLALLFPALDEDRTHLSVNIAGTKGYLSPEYASLGQVSEKADVFSFGVLVLEIISGRKNINLRLPAEQRYILEWAWKLYEEDTLSDFIDAELADRSQVEDMKHVMKLGLACVQYSAARRPSMSHVVSVLLGNKTLDAINRDSELSKGELEAMFATLQTSALTRVDEDSPLLVGLPTASASGAFIELGKLKPR